MATLENRALHQLSGHYRNATHLKGNSKPSGDSNMSMLSVHDYLPNKSFIAATRPYFNQLVGQICCRWISLHNRSHYREGFNLDVEHHYLEVKKATDGKHGRIHRGLVAASPSHRRWRPSDTG